MFENNNRFGEAPSVDQYEDGEVAPLTNIAYMIQWLQHSPITTEHSRVTQIVVNDTFIWILVLEIENESNDTKLTTRNDRINQFPLDMHTFLYFHCFEIYFT